MHLLGTPSWMFSPHVSSDVHGSQLLSTRRHTAAGASQYATAEKPQLALPPGSHSPHSRLPAVHGSPLSQPPSPAQMRPDPQSWSRTQLLPTNPASKPPPPLLPPLLVVPDAPLLPEELVVLELGQPNNATATPAKTKTRMVVLAAGPTPFRRAPVAHPQSTPPVP